MLLTLEFVAGGWWSFFPEVFEHSFWLSLPGPVSVLHSPDGSLWNRLLLGGWESPSTEHETPPLAWKKKLWEYAGTHHKIEKSNNNSSNNIKDMFVTLVYSSKECSSSMNWSTRACAVPSTSQEYLSTVKERLNQSYIDLKIRVIYILFFSRK